jgi:hypothetical protein
MSSVTINGLPVSSMRLTVGWTGPWFADIEVDDDSALTGRVSVAIGETLVLSGTVDAGRAGIFGTTRSLRVVGGANGWRVSLSPQDYANDAGIKVSSVAEDLARATGESLGSFSPASARLGTHYVRPSGLAAASLVDAIGATQWWVDYLGLTHVGSRPLSTPDATRYAVAGYEPRSGRVELHVDDLALIPVGSTIRVGEQELVARDIEIRVTPTERVIVAWCGVPSSGTRIAGMLRSIARAADSERLWGVYPYRVVRMSVYRVELQVASQSAGLPDLLPIDQWHGVPGTHATLALGSEVLVGFVEGDRRKPYIQSYVGRGGPGHAPTALELGGVGGPAAARQSDTVRVTMPTGSFEGTIGGSPATGTVTWLDPYAYGEITSGSGVVRIA